MARLSVARVSMYQPDVRSTTTALAQLYAIAMPIMAFGELTLFGQVVIAADLVFVGLALSLLAERVVERAWPRGLTRAAVVGCALYALSFAVAALASSDPTRALRKGTSALYVAAVGVAFALVCEDGARRRAVLRAWRWGAVVVVGYAAVSLIAWLTGDPTDDPMGVLLRGWSDYTGSLPFERYRRPTATFLNFNMLSTYLGATVCVHFALDDDDEDEVAAGRVWRWALLAAVVALAIATVSPTLSGTALALAWLSTRDTSTTRARAVRAVAVCAAIAIFVSTWVSPRALSDGGGLAIGPRPLCWRAAFEAWTTSLRTFVVGNGPGLPVFEVHVLAGAGFMARLTDAHHVVLSVLVQAGLVGFAGLSAALAPIVRAARHAIPTREASALVVGAFTLWGIDGLTGSFEDTRHFWVFLGLASGALARHAITPRDAPFSE